MAIKTTHAPSEGRYRDPSPPVKDAQQASPRRPTRVLGAMLESVLGSLFRKPATIRYPFEKFVMPKDFRGQPRFHSEKCTGCRLCIRDCPAQAITITKVGERKFEASIDLGKCVYCAQCAETCPRKVIDITTDFELAQIDRSLLKVVFHAEPSASSTGESTGT